MFNVIVKLAAWAEGHDTFPVGRMFEYTDDALVARFRPNGTPDLPSLIRLPTIFMEETSGQGQQVARVGTIFGARLQGGQVVLDFVYDLSIPPIANRDLEAFATKLGMAMGEFTRSHWAVKDVDLFRTLLRNLQLRRNQPTVFRVNDPPVIEPSLVSVMMPFAGFDSVYETLRDTVQAAGLRCRRADDIWENPAVIQDVVSLIDRSRVVIADCSGRNPNVFYEIGIAHALGREVILITQSPEDIPFDLRHLRYARYLNNGEGLQALAGTLLPKLQTFA